MPNRFPADIVAISSNPAGHSPTDTRLSLADARHRAVEAFEREYIRNLLARNAGRIKPSAAEADITPRQLNRLMSRYGIDKINFK
jgi:DNA-binding NtrC family response regulator